MTYTPRVWADGDCVMAADMNNIETGVDIAQGDVMVLRGLLAALPATDPTLIGRLYFATDTSELFRDNGAGWDQVFFDHGDLVGLADNDHPQYIQDAEFAALGDILVGTGAGTFANLGVGAVGEVLTVAAGTASWAAAAGGAWNLIQEQVLGAPAAAVTFAAIPGTYRVLVFFVRIRTDLAAEADWVNCRFNADAGNNYDTVWFRAQADNTRTAAGGRAGTSCQIWNCEAANARASCYTTAMATVAYYAQADAEKKINAYTHGYIGDVSADSDVRLVTSMNHWRNTAPITSGTFLPLAGANLVAGSRFALYSIT